MLLSGRELRVLHRRGGLTVFKGDRGAISSGYQEVTSE